MTGKIVIFDGSAAVGKSTLCYSLLSHSKEVIGTNAKVHVLLERPDAVFLNTYIREQKRYAFDFQVYMARNRIEVMRKAERLARLGHVVLVDRGLPGDLTFALMHRDKGNITAEQWSIYCNLLGDAYPRFLPASIVDPQVIAASHAFAGGAEAHGHLSNCEVEFDEESPIATHIVYLKTSPEVAFKRLHDRGNAAEMSGYTLDHFRSLCAKYDHTMSFFTDVVEIDYDVELAVDKDGLLCVADCLMIWNKVLS